MMSCMDEVMLVGFDIGDVLRLCVGCGRFFSSFILWSIESRLNTGTPRQMNLF